MPKDTMDSAQALHRLIAGNQRFAHGTPEHPNQSAVLRTQLAAGQTPFATILGCGDSRVPAELVFDTGLGDLFMVRSAGQALDTAVFASLEFGVGVLGTPVLVVLGHQHCGAVSTTEQVMAGGKEPGGYLDSLISQVRVSIEHAQVQGKTTMNDYIDENVRHIAGRLVQENAVLRNSVARQALQIVGLTYQMDDGLVRQVC